MFQTVVRLMSKLPKGIANALPGQAYKLYNDQTKIHVGVVLFAVDHTVERPHDEVREAHINITRFEVLDGDEAFNAKELLQHAFESRTGQQKLPPDLMADVENAFSPTGKGFLRHGSGVHTTRADGEEYATSGIHKGGFEGSAGEVDD